MRRRFVDVIRFADGKEFNEKDHPRDEDGKFTSAGATEEKDFAKSRRFKPVATYVNELASEAPVSVVTDFIKTEMQGRYVRCNVKGVGPTKISFNARFVGETASKVGKQHPANQKKIARKILIALDNIDEVLRSGQKTEWESTFKDNKHNGESFSRCFKRFRDSEDDNFFIAVAVLKRKELQKPVPYLVTVNGTRGYREMLRRQQFEKKRTGDSSLYEVSVEYVDIKIAPDHQLLP